MSALPSQPQDWRIALIVGDLNTGGAQKQSIYITHALHEAGVSLQVFYTSYDLEGFVSLEQRGIPLVNFGQAGHIPGRVIRLAHKLRQFRPHAVYALRTYLNLYAGLAAPLAGTFCIGSLRSNLSYERAHFGRLSRLVCTLPAALVVNSFTAREQIIKAGWLSPGRVVVLPNVIDLETFDQQSGGSIEPLGMPRKNIFFVGRLEPIKRIDRLLEAFPLALAQDPDLRLIIVGEGSERRHLESFAQDRGIAHAVTFLGRRKDVPALLAQQAGALVLVSEEEGFPNVLLEAMAARIPVISTSVGDAPQVVEDGVSGILIPPDDAHALAEAMLRFVHDPVLRDQFGARGRQRVEAEYAHRNLKDHIVDIIGRIFAARRGH